MKKRKHNKKGQIVIFFVFIIVAITMLIITSVIAPMGITFTEKMYEGGEKIASIANDSINNIQDVAVRQQIQDALDEGANAQQTNIEVYTDIWQYGWIIGIILIGLVMFLYTRRLVEYGGAGGFV